MIKRVILLAVLGVGPFPVVTSELQAQENFSLNDTVPLREVVVSGTKTLVNRNQIPSTVSVVTREELEESSESAILPILSERIPGLFVTERGVTGFGVSTGSAGVVNIRGVGGGNKVLMLFDGQPQWAGIFGHHLPDTYVTSDAERVEVVRGPASLLYGSNAMGGVINVITRKAVGDEIHAGGRVLFGSYNTQKYMANAGLKKGKFNVYASLNHDRTDGHRENSEFSITNGYTKVGYDFSEHWKASADVILAKFKSNNPGSVQQPKTDNWADALRGTYSFSLNNHYGNMSGAVQAFYNFGNHEVNDGWKNGAPRPYLFRSDDYNAGFAIYESFHFTDKTLVTAGIDFKQWGGHAWNDSVNGNKYDLIDKSVYEYAAYVMSQQSLTENLILNIGVRLETNETYGEEWVPQVGLAYSLSNQTSFKASASKGFRSPNIRELYMFAPAANPDLKPEYMNSYDVSYLQKLLGNKLEIELTAYFVNGKDMIKATMINGEPKNINTGRFINKGFEFAAHYTILPTLRLTGNYSFLESDIILTGAPKHQAFLNASWKVKRFLLSGSYQFVGDLHTLENDPQTEDYSLLSAKVSYKATKWANLFVNGENLTDQNYEINYGFPMPGIVVMGGVDLKF